MHWMLAHAVPKGFVILCQVLYAQFTYTAVLSLVYMFAQPHLLLFVSADACVVAGHNTDG